MKVRTGTLDIGYDERGDAESPAVVFLHGFPHNRKLWAPQLGALATSAGCRCLAPDLRGFGESSVEPPYSMDQYADDLASFLDAVGADRTVVIGLSMGGYIAFAFWRRHRSRVRALVLADTRAGADQEDGKLRRLEMIEMARSRGSEAVADAMLTGMTGKTTRERQPGLLISVRAMLASAPVAGVVGALEAMITRPDSTPTLATIDVPVLVVVGEEDTLTPPKESQLLKNKIHDSRLELIPGAGHVSNIERPSAFNFVVNDFLRVLEL
ncbi:MAG: alpha/beta fold hydrolase [Gemmatimonadaceae bacterium]